MIMLLLVMLGISLGINGLMFLVAYFRQTDKLTDISYAATFAILILVALLGHPVNSVKVVATCLVLLWAARLGSYLLIRIRKLGRDTRFDEMRHDFMRFGRFWFGQALAVWIILIPATLLMASKLTVLDDLVVLGVIVWLIGFAIESAADMQKFRFITNPTNKGQWIASGLWKFSRHPNYFGEIAMWIGVYIVAASALSAPQKLVGLAGPLFIFTLLRYVNGVPILEKSADKRWGNDAKYRGYKRSTRLLLPLKKTRVKYS